jgi:hypothetical protein
MVYIVVYQTKSKRDKLKEISTPLSLDQLINAINFMEKHIEAYNQFISTAMDGTYRVVKRVNGKKQVIEKRSHKGIEIEESYVREVPRPGMSPAVFSRRYKRTKRIGRPKIVEMVAHYLNLYRQNNPDKKLTLSNKEMVKFIEDGISSELKPSQNRYKLTKSTLRNAKKLRNL